MEKENEIQKESQNEKEEKLEKKSKRSFRRRGGFFRGVIFTLCLVGILAAAGSYMYCSIASKKMTFDVTALKNQIQKAAELTVYKNYYQTLVNISNEGKILKPHVIVRVSGVIRMGARDLKDMEVEVSDDGKTAYINMMHTEVLDNSISNEEIFDEKSYLFSRIKSDDLLYGIRNGVAAYEEELVNQGILDDADKELQKVLSSIAASFGIEKVVWRWIHSQTYELSAEEVIDTATLLKADEDSSETRAVSGDKGSEW